MVSPTDISDMFIALVILFVKITYHIFFLFFYYNFLSIYNKKKIHQESSVQFTDGIFSISISVFICQSFSNAIL